MHVRTWQHAYQGQLPADFLHSLSIEKRVQSWQEHLSTSANNATVWVAEENNTIIGFCGVGPSRDEDAHPTTGELYTIYIDPNEMGKGVGSRLMAEGLKTLKEQGFIEATLWVLETNQKARRFYESRGWFPDGATKTEPRDGFQLNEMRYYIWLT